MCFSSISVLSLTPNKPFCLTSSWFIFDVTKGSPSELYSVAHSTLTEILQTTSLLQSEHGMLPFCEDEDIWREGSTEGCIQVFSKAHSRLFRQAHQLIGSFTFLSSLILCLSFYPFPSLSSSPEEARGKNENETPQFPIFTISQSYHQSLGYMI